MATHSSILSWRISWTEEPGRLLSIGLQRVGHDWSNLAQHTFSLIKRVTNIGWQTSIFWPQLKYLLSTWVFFHLLSLPLGTVTKISNLLPNSFIYMLHPNHFLLFPQGLRIMNHMASSQFFSFLLFQGLSISISSRLKTFIYYYSMFPTIALTPFTLTAEFFRSKLLFNIHLLLAHLLTDGWCVPADCRVKGLSNPFLY